ncbi:MAG: SH3 domain-containing protein [Chloroflexi bacterium]|nr:SH3 domain-containing protein [Chloroflexota bacterium]
MILNNSTVSNNTVSRNGGGIYVNGGTVTLNNSTVSGNTAGTDGGGIYVASGALTLNNSRITGNTAGSNGGGIYVASGSLTLNNSTVSGNTVSTGGGGIYMGNGTLNIANSTISGNKADASGIGEGGGLYIYAGAAATLRHVTIAKNEAKTVGSGIYKAAGSTLNLYNSIIADSETGQDCWLEPVQEGATPVTIEENAGNLIEDTSCPNETVAVRGDPRLGRLAGSPPYHSLASGSLARDAADPAHCLDEDQRGRARGETCDIGAFEWHPPPPAEKSGSSEYIAPGPTPTKKPTVCSGEILNLGGDIRVSATHGLCSGAQFQRIGARGIGIQWIIDAGFIDAVDAWSWVEQGVEVCFRRDSGKFLFLDAATSPRAISELPAYNVDGWVCASFNRPGSIVLMPGPPVPAPTTVAPTNQILQDCMVTTTHILNFRQSPGGERLHFVDPWGAQIAGLLPSNVTLTALERTADWFKVDYHGTQGWISADYVTPVGDCG